MILPVVIHIKQVNWARNNGVMFEIVAYSTA